MNSLTDKDTSIIMAMAKAAQAPTSNGFNGAAVAGSRARPIDLSTSSPTPKRQRQMASTSEGVNANEVIEISHDEPEAIAAPSILDPEVDICDTFANAEEYKARYTNYNRRGRAWVFTFNNYTAADFKALKDLPLQGKWAGSVRYICISREVGDQGTPHLQGFVYFKNPVFFSALMDRFNCYWMPKKEKATAEHNRNYVFKLGPKWASKPRPLETFEWGVLPSSPGDGSKKGGEITKQQWQHIVELARNNNFESLAEEHPDILVRHVNGLQRVRSELRPNVPDLPPGTQVGLWLMGVPGVGKSHYAHEVFKGEGIYWKALNRWWDGITQDHQVIILDDVGGQEHSTWLGYYLKIWVMERSFNAEIKGGMVNIRPGRFVVTSNMAISEVFANCADQSLIAALERRFRIIHFTHPDRTKDRYFPGRIDETRMGFDINSINIIPAVLPRLEDVIAARQQAIDPILPQVVEDDDDDDEPLALANDSLSSIKWEFDAEDNPVENTTMPPLMPIELTFAENENPWDTSRPAQFHWIDDNKDEGPGRRLTMLPTSEEENHWGHQDAIQGLLNLNNSK